MPPDVASKGLVLVIDDDDAVRKVLVRLVRIAGFDTAEASNGSEAIRVFSERSREIVAMTLDMEMPETNGRETLAMLSAYAESVPVVIITALPMPDNLLGRAPGSPGTGYLQKPIGQEELARELNRVIVEIRD